MSFFFNFSTFALDFVKHVSKCDRFVIFHSAGLCMCCALKLEIKVQAANLLFLEKCSAEMGKTMIETREMLERIKHEGKSILNPKQFVKEDIGIYLIKLLDKHNLTPKDAMKQLNLESSYGRKIFGGSRKPTRTILLQFAFLMAMDLNETQRLLEIGERPILYPRIYFDSIIIYGIENKLTLEKMNELLEEMGEKTLL